MPLDTLQTLTEFIQEKLTEYDATLDVAPGSDVYATVVAPIIRRMGTFPTSADSAREFILDRLRELHPGLDTSAGSGVTETLVHPLEAILTPLLVEVEAARARASIVDLGALADEEVDQILGRMLVFRNEGVYAAGIARIFFASPTTVSVDPAVTFATSRGLQFVADEVRTFSPDEMQRSGSYYYVDLVVRAAEPGSAYGIGPQELTRVDGVPGAVKVTNPASFSSGTPRESNEDFFARAQRAVSERSPTTEAGFESVVLEGMPGAVVSVSTVGYGDPAMRRDVLTAEVVDAERPGEVLLTTGSFVVEPVLGLSGGMYAPFSNRLRITSPTAAQVAAIQGAAYLVLHDGMNDFSDTLISLPRRILSVTAVGADIVVVVDDFSPYPGVPSPVTAASPGNVLTNAREFSFNTNPGQGGTYDLAPVYSSVRRVAGAPLPFSESCNTTGIAGLPGAAEYGKDFLFLFGTDAIADGLRDVPNVVRAWPVVTGLTNAVRVGRPASMFERLGAVQYPGREEYRYPAGSPADRAASRGLTIVAFGAPDFSQSSVAARFEGESISPWARAPGAMLKLYDAGSWGTWAVKDPAAANLLSVALNPSQAGWAARGVRSGQHISVALFYDEEVALAGSAYFDGQLTGVDGAEGMTWYAWGRIAEVVDEHTLRVEGLDTSPLNVLGAAESSAFSWVSGVPAGLGGSTFTAAWTVYESPVDVIDGAGRVARSYVEQALLPAYQAPAAGGVAAPGPSAYALDAYVNSGPLVGNTALTGSNHDAYYIRLSDSMLAHITAQASRLTGRWYTAQPAGVGGAFFGARFPETASIAALGGDGLSQPVGLPFIDGQVDTDIDAGTVSPRSPYYANSKGAAGFLMPYPFGGGYGSAGETEFYRHTVSFLAAREAEDAPQVTVGGVPGSLPLQEFLGDVEVQPNEVHIGGMVDVYIKPAAEPTVTAAVRVTRDRIGSEVLFEASDGVIDSTSPSAFKSVALRDFLCGLTGVDPATEYGYIGEDEYGNHLAVEVVLPPTVSLFPRSFRPVNNASFGVRTDVVFTGVTGTLAGIRYRVVRSTAVNVDVPGEVLAQGASLSTTAGSTAVTWLEDIVFTPGQGQGQVYLVIEEGIDAGEYLLRDLSAVSGTVPSGLRSTSVGLAYRVVVRYPGAVLPGTVVDVTSAQVGAAQIPRAEVLRCEVDSLAAPDDDIVDNLLVGDYGTLASDGIAPATLTVAGVDWADYEVGAGDVYQVTPLVRQAETVALTVVSAVGEVITFAEVIPQVSVLSRFTGGRSAFAILRFHATDRGLAEFGPDTVVRLQDQSGAPLEFVPTLSEKSAILKNSPNQVNFVAATTTLAGDTLVAEGANLFAYGVRRTDKVEILSTCLRTGTFAPGETISAYGTTLALRIGATQHRGTFTRSAAAYSPEELVSEINQIFSGKLVASVRSSRICLSSDSELALVVPGTTGDLISAMRFDMPGAVTDSRPASLVGEYTVAALVYDEVGDTTSIVLTEGTLGAGYDYVVRVVREGSQRILPSDMQARGPLYTFTAKFRSRFPYAGPVSVAEGEVEVVRGGLVGWSSAADLPLYTYSVREGLRVVVPAVLMSATSTRGLVDAAANPQSTITMAVTTADEIDSVQRLLTLDPGRAVTANVLARHYWPAYLWADIAYSGPATEDGVRAAISEYLATRYPNLRISSHKLSRVLARVGVEDIVGGLSLGLVYLDADRRARAVRGEVLLSKASHLMASLKFVTISKG